MNTWYLNILCEDGEVIYQICETVFHWNIQESWKYDEQLSINSFGGVWIADETLSRVFDIPSLSKQELRSEQRSKIVKSMLMIWGFLIQVVFCKEKTYVVYWCWSSGAAPPKKNPPGSTPVKYEWDTAVNSLFSETASVIINFGIANTEMCLICRLWHLFSVH